MAKNPNNHILLVAVVFTAVLSSTTPASAEWQDCGVLVSSAAGDQESPHAIASGDGGAVVAWSDSRGGDKDIYVQRLDALGNSLWTADGVPVCVSAEDQIMHGIVLDGEGGVIVVWTDYRSKSAVNIDAPSPAAYDYIDIYAQRINGSGNVRWTANGVAVCGAPNNQTAPSMDSDGAGGAFFAWNDERDEYLGDVYVQHLDSLGTFLSVPGGYPICAIPSVEQGYPEIVTDGGDGALVVWRDTRDGGGYNLYAQHVDKWCHRTWAWPWGLNVTGGGSQWFYEAVSDDAGGMIVTWVQSYCYGGLYSQRLDGSGNLVWGAGGVEIHTGTVTWDLEVVKDGDGGAIIVWEDEKTGQPADVEAQAVDASGDIRWPTEGVVLCDADYEQVRLTVAADGAGGAFVAWQDARSGTLYDVFAQHVDSVGTCAWNDGIAVCTVDDYGQVRPSIVSDDQGGAIVVWEDYRGATMDVYANHIPDGTVSGSGRTLLSTRLAQNYPNPFNPVTTIAFELAETELVSLRVYDVTGRLIRTLVEERRTAGPHTVEWDARDDNHHAVASGIYLYRLTASGFSQTRKMLLLK